MTDLFCVSKLGEARGAAVIALVERTTGEACPCKQGKPCPLAPRVVDVVIERAV